jgi:hypothetical protein
VDLRRDRFPSGLLRRCNPMKAISGPIGLAVEVDDDGRKVGSRFHRVRIFRDYSDVDAGIAHLQFWIMPDRIDSDRTERSLRVRGCWCMCIRERLGSLLRN